MQPFEFLAEFQRRLLEEAEKARRRAVAGVTLLVAPPKVHVGVTPSEVIYTENKLRLLRYRPMADRLYACPLLVVFGLVNRPYILDLQPGKSVVEHFLRGGFDVYLVDWGVPDETDRFLTLDVYINRYLDHVVREVLAHARATRLSMLAYCMGGTMGAMYAAHHPRRVQNLILQAAPFDFRVPGLLHLWSDASVMDVDRLVEAYGNVPPWFLQGSFLLLKPVENLIDKYVRFFENMDDEQFVENFLAMQEWVNDNIPVAGETFREFVKSLYQENRLIEGRMRLGGKSVDLRRITCPLLVLAAAQDHLVPPEACERVAEAVGSRDRKVVRFPTGHIGLSVGSAAQRTLWPDVVAWLQERSGTRRATGARRRKRVATAVARTARRR